MIKLGHFLTLSVALAISIGAANASSKPATETGAKRGKPMIGLQLYTVRDACAKDFEGTVKEVAKIGFSGVEFAGFYNRTAEQVKKMLDDNHLKCYGTHTGWGELQGENFDKTVAFMKTIGNKFIVVPSLSHDRLDTKAHIIETCKIFDELATKLDKVGIMLGYHNHAAEFQKVDGEYIWDIFFANTDKRVKIQFDTGNALSGGAQAAPFLVKYPGRVVSSHVKDFSATNSNALLGEGDVNWKEVIPALKGKAGVRWFIIEQESYPFPSIVCAEKCLRTFEKMYAEK